jgi:hypothetical protein
MGIQQVQDVTLIRHAYVRTLSQKQGLGALLLLRADGSGRFDECSGVWPIAILGSTDETAKAANETPPSLSSRRRLIVESELTHFSWGHVSRIVMILSPRTVFLEL